jgi:hypothetical protein
MERPAPIRSTWVMLRIGRNAVQSHKREKPVYEENKICGVGCPCGDDCGSGSGARGGNTVPGNDSESRGVGSEAGQETGAGGAVAILLWSGSDPVRVVLAADEDGSGVRGGSADVASGESRRSREDRPPGCVEAGAELSRRRVDGGVGAGCGA